jgi:hypothetical protein
MTAPKGHDKTYFCKRGVMRKAFCFVFLAAMVVTAKDRKDIPKAPLPSELVTAKKVFLAKGAGANAHTVEGGFDLAFDAFYSEMKSWGRYAITDKPEDADLIMEISYKVTEGGPRVWSSTNTSNNQTDVYSTQTFDAQLTLMVYDSHTKTALWSTTVPPGRAFRKKNQEKEMIKAGETLVTNLKERLGSSGALVTMSEKDREFPVKEGGSSSPTSGSVSVSSTPDSADLYVDGVFKGNTPSTLSLAPGKHTVKITSPGYKDWEREIDVTAGSVVKLTANLQK